MTYSGGKVEEKLEHLKILYSNVVLKSLSFFDAMFFAHSADFLPAVFECSSNPHAFHNVKGP